MRTIARFMDARNTAEGKFLSVLLSVLLVFSFLNVTMFTDYANATDENAPEATVEENQSLDAVDPAADESEGDAQPESEEPEAEVNESGAKEPEAAAEQEPSSDRETVYADAPVVEEQEAMPLAFDLAAAPKAAASDTGAKTMKVGETAEISGAESNWYHSWKTSDSSVVSLSGTDKQEVKLSALKRGRGGHHTRLRVREARRRGRRFRLDGEQERLVHGRLHRRSGTGVRCRYAGAAAILAFGPPTRNGPS